MRRPASSPRNTGGRSSPETALPQTSLPQAPAKPPLPVSSAPGRARSLALPRTPVAAPPHSFPVLAVLAPVIGSVLIWALTRSPFALVFALLGPLVAIASVADGRIQSRRTAKREAARFELELAATLTAIEGLQVEERATMLRAAPGVSGLTVGTIYDPERWRTSADSGVPVRLGLGSSLSAVLLEGGTAARSANDDPVQLSLDRLHLAAATIEGVPIVVDARLSIGVCGPAPLALAFARGILMQLAGQLPPRTTVFSAADATAGGLSAELPHSIVHHPKAVPGTGSIDVHWKSESETGVVAVAAWLESIPTTCRVVVQVGAGRTVKVVRAPEKTVLGPLPMNLQAEFVSAEQARQLAQFLAESATILDCQPPTAKDIDNDFYSLPVPARNAAAAGSLACVFGRELETAGGMVVDLVAQGPHAVVGGTTGSGKSELLISWVLAMARAHPPTAVNFLLVDFKGGATFEAIHDLPHVVGVVTDLDEITANRAMLSLRSELRFRERVIAAAGARSIDGAGVNLPRLVIVVDEFAAMAADYPQLHELFADLAARGRSLGLHLVLCTQRPAGVIRDAVLANATLRISLRVNNRADSIAVLGTEQAAQLDGDTPGLALLAFGAEPPRLLRVARPTESDIRAVIDQHPATGGQIRRPWCDDLPAVVALSSLELAGEGIPFALIDLPEEQCQKTVRYHPARDGNLLVVGAQGSGKSELFAILAAADGVETIPSTPELAWDVVEAAVARVRAGVIGPQLLLADDLDGLLARFSPEYQSPFIDRLIELARDGTSVSLQIAVSARRISPSLQTIAALCDFRLILPLASLQDHLMAGGASAVFSLRARPGAGEWRGSRIQVALSAADSAPNSVRAPAEAPEFGFGGYSKLIVVTTRVAEFTRRLSSNSALPANVSPISVGRTLPTQPRTDTITVADTRLPTVYIGDPDSWQANWTLLGELRATALMVIDRCAVTDFRAITARRELPPPLKSGGDQCWTVEADGAVGRMSAPPAGPAAAQPA